MYTVLIDPVIFSWGPLQVRWYGLMYVLAFIVATYIFRRLSKEGFFKANKKQIDSLVTYILIGMFIGARLVYVFIYNWNEYVNNLWDIFAVWKGGLSFHGGLIGFVMAIYFFARRNKIPFFQVSDCTAVAASLGLGFGRTGNFINGELFGRVTEVPWGMIFPNGGGPFPRHPSQLYEAFFEGLILFLLLWLLHKRVKYYGILSSIFLIFYGLARYFIEFFREADVQLGYYWGGTTTMGQILCLLTALAGVLLLIFAFRLKVSVVNNK